MTDEQIRRQKILYEEMGKTNRLETLMWVLAGVSGLSSSWAILLAANLVSAPSPYSPTIPNLQIVWDSTSLRALQFCARSYQYGILHGWRGSAVDLEFGILLRLRH